MISGNTVGYIQVQGVTQSNLGNEIGSWESVMQVFGFLDVTAGGTNVNDLMHRVEDSDYIFLCEYFTPEYEGEKLTPANSRMLIDGEIYEVKLYDDPMRLHQHIEIYLRYLGGQANGN